MLKFLINAISRALSFTKTESKGTLVLILIILMALLFKNYKVNQLKKHKYSPTDSSALEWIGTVHASYEIRKEKPEEFDKTVYYPAKKNASAKKESKPAKEKLPGDEPFIVADLNTANALDLQKVKGIGPAYSERIIKYRDILGGFTDTTQLHEVYGLHPETIRELAKHFSIQSSVKRIEINTDSIKTLIKHPYINYDLARIIINYREQHGDFTSAEDLRKIKALDDRTFLRLKPYLE
ncbi:helix-hairpin-helix domain-containing protein [Ekhidna sp.]|uniref:ComEA family DNA-binding protein n=1 Tax=Ekhidna sp. TaxID=2608089 RepID=UPI0032EEB1C4